MAERINPLRFRWAKRFVAAAEVTGGAFVLAWTTALIFQAFVVGASVPQSEIDSLSQTLAVMLLVGVVLFFDGLRRGRQWWS